ncbi:SCO2322 family protein [Streptomyces sp. NPDC048659]|uniref:SCO2322 family protein n=1 Tax=Streptomyces sp. NPDC048659 TaxID=3155489 RepID=UPI003432152B
MLLAAAPAQAAGYRYWSFWEAGGTGWAYATQGPATARPADGDTIGFRFAVSADSNDATRPTALPDFGKICATAPKGTGGTDGTKTIAVVVDFGTAQDAPPGEAPPAPSVRTGCAEVRADATAAEALAAVAKPLRYDTNAMLCGIAGYPAKGCGEQVATDAAAARPSSAPSPAASGEPAAAEESGGPSLGLLAGGAAVLALGVAGVWQARRRRG